MDFERPGKQSFPGLFQQPLLTILINYVTLCADFIHY